MMTKILLLILIWCLCGLVGGLGTIYLTIWVKKYDEYIKAIRDKFFEGVNRGANDEVKKKLNELSDTPILLMTFFTAGPIQLIGFLLAIVDVYFIIKENKKK